MIYVVAELFPIAKRKIYHSLKHPGLMYPSFKFLTCSPNNFVNGLLGFPSLSHSWKQTSPNYGFENNLNILLYSILFARCSAFLTVYLTYPLNLSSP